MMNKKDYFEILREVNLKVTPKRKAIIGFFLQEGKYFSAEEVWKSLKKEFEHLGFPTVYRNLEELENIGILIKINHPQRKFYYAICHLCKKEKHHHFICKRCGRVDEVEFCNFENIVRDIERKLDCKITSHFTQIEGLCSECKRRKDRKGS